ncbi:MAG: serine hydrolase domain-containing protein [Hyphomonadaceae bacterium]
MRLLSLGLALGLALLAPATASAQLTKEAQALRNFSAELDGASTAPDFVGLAVAVVKQGKIVMMRTYGVREAGGTDKVTPDTVFRIASLSKGFASTLAVLEQSEGKLDLQTHVTSLLPEFKLKRPADAARVTFEDVLSHRTGLPPYAYDNMLEAGTPTSQILTAYGKVRQTCAPGECFTYQNVAFNMITALIEKATGKSYATELRNRIIDPLDMKTASVGMQDLMANNNWARPHKRVGDGWVSVPVTDYYYKVPAAGGVNASITDLSKWLIAQMGYRPDVLPKAVLDEAHRKRISTPPETARQRSLKTPVKDTSYALGWRTYNYAGNTLYTHSGSVEGYIAQIAWLPAQDAGIVVLSNTRGSRASKIVPDWLDYQLGLEKTDWFRLSEITEAANPPANASGD